MTGVKTVLLGVNNPERRDAPAERLYLGASPQYRRRKHQGVE